MGLYNLISSGRLVFVFWLVVGLGSCAAVEYNSSVVLITVGEHSAVTPNLECMEFKREERKGHVRPTPPVRDISRLDQEAILILLFDYTEELSNYIDKEEEYLLEDTLHHNERCTSN